MGKPKRKPKQDDDQQVDDIMAWGKSKQNYYQESQQEYSQASEEQHQAKEIYDKQLQELNRDQYYQVPEEDEQKEYEEEESQEIQGEINDEYICYEMLWVTELAKLFSGIHDEKSELRKKIYDSYLLILMTLKQFKIPYMDQHPLVANLPFLKKALQHFQKQLPVLYEKMQENEVEDNDQIVQNPESEPQQEQIMEDEQEIRKKKYKKKIINENSKEGLQIYQKIKRQKQEERKLKKSANKKAREQSRPKQAFRLVNENEGRLANQKILKNKGLMKRRRRDDGNSRTKLRHKFEKAMVRRRAKGFNGVKENPGRFYEGEDKVLYGKIASTKLN